MRTPHRRRAAGAPSPSPLRHAQNIGRAIAASAVQSSPLSTVASNDARLEGYVDHDSDATLSDLDLSDSDSEAETIILPLTQLANEHDELAKDEAAAKTKLVEILLRRKKWTQRAQRHVLETIGLPPTSPSGKTITLDFPYITISERSSIARETTYNRIQNQSVQQNEADIRNSPRTTRLARPRLQKKKNWFPALPWGKYQRLAGRKTPAESYNDIYWKPKAGYKKADWTGFGNDWRYVPEDGESDMPSSSPDRAEDGIKEAIERIARRRGRK